MATLLTAIFAFCDVTVQKNQTRISGHTTYGKYSGPSPGFRSRVSQNHNGGYIFKYNIGCMQQPGNQT